MRYLQRDREGILPARHVVAKAQIELRPYQALDMVLKNESLRYIPDAVPQVNDRNLAHLIITGEDFRIRFNKMTGYMERYAVDGTEFIRKGDALTPNFWRAPTDNDYGAKLQQKYAAWKNPDLHLTSLKHETKDGQVVVSAEYDMRNVSAKLYLTYTINNRGAVRVNQKMVADKGKKVSEMFRFGMQLVMPKDFEIRVLLRSRAGGELQQPQPQYGPWHLSPDRRRAVLSLHPSARDWHENRHPLVESPRRERHGVAVRGRCSVLGFLPALHHRIVGRRAGEETRPFAGSGKGRPDQRADRQGADGIGLYRQLECHARTGIPPAVWRL